MSSIHLFFKRKLLCSLQGQRLFTQVLDFHSKSKPSIKLFSLRETFVFNQKMLKVSGGLKTFFFKLYMLVQFKTNVFSLNKPNVGFPVVSCYGAPTEFSLLNQTRDAIREKPTNPQQDHH